MLSPSPYFINEVTEVEMWIILLKVSLWESNLALVQYQILWPSKLLNFREEDYPDGYMTVVPLGPGTEMSWMDTTDEALLGE